MRVTAIVNPKGGTGKTTTAVSLAAAAALDGQRVVLVDMDKQGSATQWLGHSPENEDLVNALLGKVAPESIVISTSVPGLDLIPASVAVQHESVTGEAGAQLLLREMLDKLNPRDWVVIDAPGDLGPITIMALTAATDVLIPVPAGAMELDEVPKVRTTIAKVRQRLNPTLSIAGVLLTQVRVYGRNTSVLAREVGAQLRVDFDPSDVMQAYIRDDMRFREAPASRSPISVYDPDGKGDLDYRAALNELMGRVAIDA